MTPHDLMAGLRAETALARPGQAAVRALAVAAELRLLERIERGADTLEALAAATQSSHRGLDLLLDALAGHGLLVRDGPRLVLPAEAPSLDPWADGAAALHRLQLPAAQALARELTGTVTRLLDVAAGTGVWTVPLACADGAVEVEAVDEPWILDRVTRDFARQAGCDRQYRWRPGPPAEVWDRREHRGYDLIVLNHVLQGLPFERVRRFLARAWRALRPGGRVLLAEAVPREREPNSFPDALSGLRLLTLSEADLWTAYDLEEMLQEAGFVRGRWRRDRGVASLLMAERP